VWIAENIHRKLPVRMLADVAGEQASQVESPVRGSFAADSSLMR